MCLGLHSRSNGPCACAYGHGVQLCKVDNVCAGAIEGSRAGGLLPVIRELNSGSNVQKVVPQGGLELFVHCCSGRDRVEDVQCGRV